MTTPERGKARGSLSPEREAAHASDPVSALGPCLGAKAALICEGQILTYLRDDRPDLPWAGHWDLPGGGIEAGETALDCLLRETFEEFGLRLPPERLIYRKAYPALDTPHCHTVFFAGWLEAGEIGQIRFGEEGQYWRMMAVEDFLGHPRAVPHFQTRLRSALAVIAPRSDPAPP